MGMSATGPQQWAYSCYAQSPARRLDMPLEPRPEDWTCPLNPGPKTRPAPGGKGAGMSGGAAPVGKGAGKSGGAEPVRRGGSMAGSPKEPAIEPITPTPKACHM